uniref:Uncharacterized protein n=1 Tax=Ditylenchus dipsaci TaxID=166011 RepID=A0A915D315_9BILA
MADGWQEDCLDGSDEESSYAALFKVLAYVGNPIHPAVIALLGSNPVPTQPFFVPVPPISPVIPIQPEVHADVQPITQRPYYWFRTTTTSSSSQEQPFWNAEGTTKALETVESTGTKAWQGPILDDFGYPFGPSTFAFTSRHTTGPPPSSKSTIGSENVTVTLAGHKPAQEGWLIFPPPPITGNQPAENGHIYSPQSTMPTPVAGSESVPLDSFYPLDVSTTEKSETTAEPNTSSSKEAHLLASSTEKIFPFVPFVFTFPPTASTNTPLARETTISSTPPLTNTLTTSNQSNISSTAITSEWTEVLIFPSPTTLPSSPDLSSHMMPSSANPSTKSSSRFPLQPLDGLEAIVPVKVGTLAPAAELTPCSQPGVDCALPTQNSYGGLQWPMGPARPFMPWSRKPDFVRYTTPRNPFPEESPGSAFPGHSIYTIQPSPVNPETEPPDVWVPEQSSNHITAPSKTSFTTRLTQESESLSSITGQTMTSLIATTTAVHTSYTDSASSEVGEDLSTISSSTQSGHSTSIPSEDHYPVVVWPAGVNLEAYNNSDKFTNLSTKNCTERLKQMAKDLAPQPMCECPAGQLKDVSSRCIRADISTFRVRLARFCGTRAYEFETEELEVAVILMKLSAILQVPMCVRDVDDMAASVMPDMDVKISELDRSGCYQFDINDCDEKAECIPQAFVTNAIVCLAPMTLMELGPSAKECKQILGVCILVWVMMFLLLCFMIPILTYFWIKYCKGGEFIQRVEKWKQSILGKKTESTENLGSGDIESAPTTPAPVPFRKDSGHPKTVAQDTLTVPLPVSLKPKASAVVPVEPPKDYYIVENVEEGEAESPSDDESISSSEYAAPVRGGDTTVPVEVHEERPGSAQSRAGTPTIWRLTKFLVLNTPDLVLPKVRRKSSTQSLDSLIRQREQEALEQLQARRALQSQSSSLREEDSSVASSPKRVLSRQQTTTVIGGDKTPTTSVSTPRISESIEARAVDEPLAVNNILSAAAQRVEQMGETGVDRVEQQEISADSTSVYVPTPPPTTPAKATAPSTSTSVGLFTTTRIPRKLS